MEEPQVGVERETASANRTLCRCVRARLHPSLLCVPFACTDRQVMCVWRVMALLTISGSHCTCRVVLSLVKTSADSLRN